MNKIDGSNTIRYGALINGIKVVQMISNGTTVPHITLKEWYNIVKFNDEMKVHKDHRVVDYSNKLKYNKKGMLR